MKTIEIKEQVRLPMSRCVELVTSGVKFRLFRAAVTVVIVALAVAFLVTMLTESLTARRVASAVAEITAPRDLFLYWVGRVSSPMRERQLTDELAELTPSSPRWEEFAIWGGQGLETPVGKLPDERLEALMGIARRQVLYERGFFNSLEEGERRPLLGRAKGVDIFTHLQSPENLETFETELRRMGQQLATPLEEFRRFLNDWRKTAPDRQAVLRGHRDAVNAVKEDPSLLQNRSAQDLFADAGDELVGELAKYGFRMQTDKPAVIREQARLSRDADRIRETINIQLFKARLAGRLHVTDAIDLNPQMLLEEVDSSGGAKWLVKQFTELRDKLQSLPKKIAQDKAEAEQIRRELEQLRSSSKDDGRVKDLDEKLLRAEDRVQRNQEDLNSLRASASFVRSFNLSADRIEKVASSQLGQARMAEIEANVSQTTAGSERGFLGFSGRTLWLIIVSLMVCVVGITNAMLMSVTERFREIATMKCLGATDGFIMTNFILESCMQGLAGGTVGVVLGIVLGALRSLAGYGWLAMEQLPFVEVVSVAGLAIVLGAVLSALAAVYPAWIAARLAPMEAMRIE